MKSIILFCFLLYTINGLKFEEDEDKKSLSPSSVTSIPVALNTLRRLFNDEKTVRQFFHENVVNNKDFNYCGKPSSCAELFYIGFKASGIYNIYPKPWMNSKEILVYCDMATDGGGWTVIQRRGDFGGTPINFTRDWISYSGGFGDLSQEFWLGNENIHVLSTQDNVILRIDLEDFKDNHRHAVYSEFEVANKDQLFKLRVKNYTGNAGDSFSSTNNATFVTYDNGDINSCAKNYKGGWWYIKCHRSNLNGRYLRGNHTTFADGVNWKDWLGFHYSLKWTEMKLRPKHFK